LKYATSENFLGRPVAGYNPGAKNLCLLAPNAAHALCQVQSYLNNEHQLGLIIYDAYRPLRAVKDFYQWIREPATENELARKAIHYPHITKAELPELGYIADDVSRHCFAGTVDLSLVRLSDHNELNMGAVFDYFDSLSHDDVGADLIGEEAFQNRQLLKHAMEKFGFNIYQYEYWHFDYREQEINQPLDIVIDRSFFK
jgi:D-alanyl-D-alanine dipeptidase